MGQRGGTFLLVQSSGGSVGPLGPASSSKERRHAWSAFDGLSERWAPMGRLMAETKELSKRSAQGDLGETYKF